MRQTTDRDHATLVPKQEHLDEQLALQIEYSELLKRLSAFNERVAGFRKAGISAHFAPRLSLRRLHNWARLYIAGKVAA